MPPAIDLVAGTRLDGRPRDQAGLPHHAVLLREASGDTPQDTIDTGPLPKEGRLHDFYLLGAPGLEAPWQPSRGGCEYPETVYLVE